MAADEPTVAEATAAMQRAVKFFREHCSTSGGYVYRVSSDLTMHQGEEPVGPTTAWTQPPGTPAVGMAYLDAYRLTRDPQLLAAAQETAQALIRGQLVSGGWDNSMEFDPEKRKKYAYRVDLKGAEAGKRSNTTTFDDDKSQSALRFLMQLDQETEFKEAALHEAALYALDAFIHAQYPNGAWPQRFSTAPVAAEFPVVQATIPADWPREFSGVKYASYYTLNDGTMRDLIATMLLAYDVYQDERYLAAAKRGGDFFLLAQLPEPQPGWAQQYNREMQPAWARKFEPPAITGGESQGVMQSLLLLYRRTGEKKYLEPLPPALDYYRKCLLPDGQLARFYELGTNKPLYLTQQYTLTYADNDLPTHYSFKVDTKLDAFAEQLDEVQSLPADKLWKPPTVKPVKPSKSVTEKAAKAIAALDDRGAWVESGTIRDIEGRQHETQVIESKTFIKHLDALADYIAANRQ